MDDFSFKSADQLAHRLSADLGIRVRASLPMGIGELYFELPRSADLADIMYTPIMSLEDIDAMGLDYKRRGAP